MVKGIGIDLVEVEDFRKKLTPELIQELFTEGEILYCRSQVRYWENFAGRFAAKEAAFKALGHGLSSGLRFSDVEIVKNPDTGAVSIQLLGTAGELASDRGIRELFLSISHTGKSATAMVIATS